MKARVPARSASEGLNPSTVGMNPGESEDPGRGGARGAQDERVAHHRAHREPAQHGPLGAEAGALEQASWKATRLASDSSKLTGSV